MSQLDPINNPIIDSIKNLQEQVLSLSNTRQPYNGDWYQYTEELVYATPTEVRTTNTLLDLRNVFAIGDPVRYLQGGVDKYGYITRVDQGRLRIRAGSDYAVSNEPITEFYRGLKNNPLGFPVVFNQANSNFRVPAGSISFSSSPANTRVQFSMQGPIISMRVLVLFATVSIDGITIFLDLPAKSAEDTNPFRVNYSTARGPNWGYAKLTDNSYLEIVPALGQGYPSGTGNVDMNFAYDFLVGED